MSSSKKEIRVIKSCSDFQKLKLEKLMKNVDKPVYIPEPAKSRSFPEPPEFVRNVMGSSAGAGSGEFHVYRHIRRREYARVKHINSQAEKEELDAAYQEKLASNKLAAEERTAKKRAKRLKKKARKRVKLANKPLSSETGAEADHSSDNAGCSDDEQAEDVEESCSPPGDSPQCCDTATVPADSSTIPESDCVEIPS